jgi:hypothetical protein
MDDVTSTVGHNSLQQFPHHAYSKRSTART